MAERESTCDTEPSTWKWHKEDQHEDPTSLVKTLEVPTSLVKLNGPLQLVVQTILAHTKAELQEMTHIIKSGQERAEQLYGKLELAVRERMESLEAVKNQQVQPSGGGTQPSSMFSPTAFESSGGWGSESKIDGALGRRAFESKYEGPLARETLAANVVGKVKENGEASCEEMATFLEEAGIRCLESDVIEGTEKSDASPKVRSTAYASAIPSPSKRDSLQASSRLQKIVFGHGFDRFFGVLIVLNAIIIGVEVEYRSTHATTHTAFVVIGVVFAFFFTMELLLRMIASGPRRFLFGRDMTWNLFDFSMVLLSLVEVIQLCMDGLVAKEAKTKDSGGSNSSMLRIVRMARLVRIIRVLRFSPQLRMMIFMILESVKQLSWLCCLLVSILYVFSICFTMGATEYLGVPSDPSRHMRNRAEIQEYYGTILRSIYTCFKSMTGGVSWGEVMDPLNDVGKFYLLLFLFYIAFAVLALLNVVTGVFVDGALAKSQHDRDMVAEKEIQQKRAYVTNLREIFEEADADESGSISREEFDAYMHGDEKNAAYLWSMQIDTSDLDGLFTTLDRDGSGAIDTNEFVESLLGMMKGHSTHEYVDKMLLEYRSIKHLLYKLASFTEKELNRVTGVVSSLGWTTRPGGERDAVFVDL